MNDLAKRIIHSVGIVLVGALFSLTIMGVVGCHIQPAYADEGTSLRQKKEQQGTTDNGFISYYFDLPEGWDETNTNTGYAFFYRLDNINYNPTMTDSQTYTDVKTISQNLNAINSAISYGTPTTANTYIFLAYFNVCQIWNTATFRYTAYFSFLPPTEGTQSLTPRTFLIAPNWANAGGLSRTTAQWAWGNTGKREFYLNFDISDIFLIDNTTAVAENGQPLQSVRFQDVTSYYQDSGYTAGETAGYGSGYQDGYHDGTEATLLFTDLGCNQKRWYLTDLTASDSTDTTTTYKLLTYKDGNNTTHSVWGTRYATDDSFIVSDYAGTTPSSQYSRVQIGSGTWLYSQSEGWYCDVVPNNYVHHDFGQVTGVFNNSIPFNYFMLSGLPANATGYQQGYNNGYRDGLNSTAGGMALDNVFGIFSKAFGATATFFNMKVFGFLPLYWFFLVPIFIAVVTLLLRMVKH